MDFRVAAQVGGHVSAEHAQVGQTTAVDEFGKVGLLPAVVGLHRMSTLTLLTMPPWLSASARDLYESGTPVYLPTTAMVTLLSGFLKTKLKLSFRYIGACFDKLAAMCNGMAVVAESKL